MIPDVSVVFSEPPRGERCLAGEPVLVPWDWRGPRMYCQCLTCYQKRKEARGLLELCAWLARALGAEPDRLDTFSGVRSRPATPWTPLPGGKGETLTLPEVPDSVVDHLFRAAAILYQIPESVLRGHGSGTNRIERATGTKTGAWQFED